MDMPNRCVAGARLTRGWSRALVVTTAASALGIALLNVLAMDRPTLRHGISIGLGLAIVVSVWLLADTLWPWLGGDRVSVEERAHADADAAVRESYRALFGVAIAVLIYLQLAETRPAMAPDAPHHGRVILWTFVALVVLLPVWIAAWTGPVGGSGGRPLGPWGLVRARFGGASVWTYAAGAAAFATTVPLAAVGAGMMGGDRGRVAHAVVLVGFLVALAIAVALLRIALSERERGANGRTS
jgi:hypothetical protein